jgi:hypothetical protein
MNTHSVRDPHNSNPQYVKREHFQVAHLTFEICDHPEGGQTFAIIAGEALRARDRKPMCSGHVQIGMGAALRRLARRCDALEAKIKEESSDG